jgi:hypothetical protein
MVEKKEQLKLTKIRSQLQKNYIGMNIIDSFQKINLRNEAVKRKNEISEQQQIEEILEEANAYSLREEVKDTAKKIIKKEPTLPELSAYVMAYNEWIK